MYLKASKIRQRIRECNHRMGRDFLAALDGAIEEILETCCAIHNGGKRTLDATILAHVLRTRRVR